ncbi:MAG: translation initiation factor IF-2, partial [Clostridiales bacterium]|nr:translation initiation factor IF-2 [Clostridiales bacterium]
AGCRVLDGKITRSAKVRLIRNSAIVTECEIASLKHKKEDVKEIAKGYECGILLSNFNDIKKGDIIEAFVMEQIK